MRFLISLLGRGWIKAEHRHSATGPRAKALENFYSRRLSGAVRSQQPEDFTGLNFEVYTPQPLVRCRTICRGLRPRSLESLA